MTHSMDTVIAVGGASIVPLYDFLRKFAYPDIQHMETLTALDTIPQLPTQVLVIIDLDGEDDAPFNLLAMLTARAKAGTAKIIALATSPSETVIQKAKAAKISALLTKPVSPDQLADRINKLVA